VQRVRRLPEVHRVVIPGPWDRGSPRDVSAYDPRAEGARCDLCPLRGKQVVPAEPPRSGKKPLLILVGEGPGRKEEIYKVPFIGQSGSLLDDTLSDVGVARAEVFVANAALCRGDTDKEADRAAECCAPRLARELSALPSSIPIVPLGKQAAKSILGTKGVLLIRGFVWTARDLSTNLKAAGAALRKAERAKKGVQEAKLRLETVSARQKLEGRTVFPTVHPAFVLRSDAWTPILRLDLDRATRWARGELKEEHLADKIERVKTVRELVPGTYLATDEARTLRAAASKLEDTISCDIETESVDPLSPLTVKVLCVGLSDAERTVVFGPWRKEIHADLLTEILSTRTVVMHNGYNFDQPGLEKDGVKIDPNKVDDTLIAHHAFASHMPQRLDHVVSTFLDARPWKIRFGRRQATEKGLPPQNMEPDELYFYNACDCVLTARAWRAMQADLASEQEVYAHDKEIATFCKNMQVTGFRVDRKRKRLLSGALKRRAAALKGRLRTISGIADFMPGRLGEVRRILFTRLRAPMLNPTSTGLASTSNATLEVLKMGKGKAARFSDALLRWRVVCKIRSTYIEAVSVHRDHRAHYNWKSFGTVSGRFSCRMQSCPRWSTALEDRVREMYVAGLGCELFYFDLSQAEARFAANLSGDPEFINTCRGDVHVGNALVLFPEARAQIEKDPKGKYCLRHGAGGSAGTACTCGKPYRDVAKNAGFAVAYLAEAPTVFAYLRAQGFPVELGDVEAMLDRLKSSYRVYYEYVAENVAFVAKNGYLRTPLVGRIRWLGYSPPPTEVANGPIQSGIADVMNVRLLALQTELRGLVYTRTKTKTLLVEPRIVGQYHDAAVIEARRGDDRIVPALERLWKEPVRLPASIVCREAREFFLPTEIKRGRRWSEF
jgi:uracil-DNA glycosylase family 4